jgi:glycosyltransferase involved in cell wall biosynthesis
MPSTPKVFSLIIPVYKSEEFVDDCLNAIKEQDYKHWETIGVINTHNAPFIKKYKKKFTKLVEIDIDNGAPYARNRGAEAATGDYIVMVDPDVNLNPGILTLWAEAFRKHPEVSFVYTDYEIYGRPGEKPQVFPARKWDAYRLTCNNFISGGNPIKREAFTPQDESLKSLQDWDMWLTAMDKGHTGFYIEEFSGFKTYPPHTGSVSWDSYRNWQERRDTVRDKHGIPRRDVCVISMGAPFHGLNAAKILGADFYDHPVHKENIYKTVYLIGCYPTAAEAHIAALSQNLAKDIKRIVHWIGTDVYQLMHNVSWIGMKDLKKIFEELKVTHWTEFEPTRKEMSELGFDTTIVPLPTSTLYDPHALPEEFSVGVYINDTQDMYFENEMYDIARAMPDIKFKFFGSKKKVNHSEENKEWVGFVDMDKFINETSCLLRITRHDGLPLGPVEFFMKGRDVVTNVDMPFATKIEATEGKDMKQQILKSIRDIKEAGKVNVEASNFYRELMNHDKFKETFYAQV